MNESAAEEQLTSLVTQAPGPARSSWSGKGEPIGPGRWAILFGVWAIYFSFGLIVSSLPVLIGPIARDLHLSGRQMGEVLGAWSVAYIGTAIPLGALLDRVGPRPALLAAAVIIAASGVARAAATNFATMFLSVCLIGVGGPLLSIGAPKVIMQRFFNQDRGFAMGIYITGPAVAGVMALSCTRSVVMPFFAESWRATYAAFVGVPVLSGLFWYYLTSSSARRRGSFHPIEPKNQFGWDNFRILLGSHPIRIILISTASIFGLEFGLQFWMPEIVRHAGFSASASGYWAAVPTAVGIVSAIVVPRFAIPKRRVRVLASLFLIAGISTFLLTDDSVVSLTSGLVLFGVVRNTMLTIAMLLLIERKEVGEQRAGVAGGLFFTVAHIGTISGSTLIGQLLDWTGGFRSGLHVMTGVCVLLLFLLFRFRAIVRIHPT